jgi:hypothetical protein
MLREARERRWGPNAENVVATTHENNTKESFESHGVPDDTTTTTEDDNSFTGTTESSQPNNDWKKMIIEEENDEEQVETCRSEVATTATENNSLPDCAPKDSIDMSDVQIAIAFDKKSQSVQVAETPLVQAIQTAINDSTTNENATKDVALSLTMNELLSLD